MAVFARKLQTPKGTVTNGVITLYGKVVTGSSGDISSSSCDGFSVVKTDSETGRYTITLDGTVTEILYVGTTILGADDTAYTDAKGITTIIRDNDVSTDGTFELQFLRNTTNADTEIVNDMSFFIRIDLKLSSVNP